MIDVIVGQAIAFIKDNLMLIFGVLMLIRSIYAKRQPFPTVGE
jgi:uncharacterized membrane protein